jgi:hypothetical protein
MVATLAVAVPQVFIQGDVVIVCLLLSFGYCYQFISHRTLAAYTVFKICIISNLNSFG